MIVGLGMEWLADRAIGRGIDATHILLSNGLKPPELGDIAICGDASLKFDIIGRDRVGTEVQYTAKIPPGAAVGFFTESALMAGDLMVGRCVFPPVEIRKADEATIDYFVQVK